MATIHKLKKEDSIIYPATISDAIVHQDTGATLTEMINDYNVTQLYPTLGLLGGSTYDLVTAVEVLSLRLTTAEKRVGTKLSFTDSVTGRVREYIFQGGTFSSISGWVLSGDVHLADDTEGTGEVPEFDAYTDTLHVTAQELSDLQKTQARANLGLGNGNIDNEPTAGSENLVKSGGVYNGIKSIVDSYDTSIADLDFLDEQGNSIMMLVDGHIKTKNFDSSKDATEESRGLMSSEDKAKLSIIEEGAEVNNINIDNTSIADLDFSDELGNTLVLFKNGHIKTKNFDSSVNSISDADHAKLDGIEAGAEVNDVNTDNISIADLDFSDELGNTLVSFSNGHIKTKNFDSSVNSISDADHAKLDGIEAGAEVNDVNTDNTEYLDLDFSDELGNILVMFNNGHIKTKNFDSSNIFHYADRPASGYENFLVDVNIAIENNDLTSMSLQDSVNLKKDRCFFALPENYNPNGEPIRLIVISPGSGTAIKSTTTHVSITPSADVILAEGYAVLTANGTPGYLDGIPTYGGMATPSFLKSILAAYNYVINKYNIKRDGVLLSGFSQGTAEVWQIAANKILPVKAMTLFGPCVDLWKLMYAFGDKNDTIETLDGRNVNPREWMCEQFGFVEKEANSYVLDIFGSIYSQGNIVTKPTVFSNKRTVPTDAEFAYILNNYEKWLGYDPICWGTSKDIIGEQFRYRNWVTTKDPNEDLCFQDVANIVPCPIKMFVGTSDQLTTPKIVNWYKTMADNAGMMCHVRTYQGGTHSYGSTSIYPTVEVQTKYGGTLTPTITTWEGMLFLERYD